MKEWLQRNITLFGKDKVEYLGNTKVIILGVGGVGSYVAESLARSNIGTLILVDKDIIDITNINRQIHALHSTIGKDKVTVMKERILDINPKCNVITHKVFIDKENITNLITDDIDFVVDAIDTITSKYEVIKYCLSNDIKIISAMGAGNKYDPTKFKLSDISKTKYDPIAKVIRQKLRKDIINKNLMVVYSEETPSKASDEYDNNLSTIRKENYIIGSNAFVPSTMGLIMSSYVINTLIDEVK